MTSETALSPLDRVRRYVSSLQVAGRSPEEYVSVSLGDLGILVTRMDVLKSELATALGDRLEEQAMNAMVALPVQAPPVESKGELRERRQQQIGQILNDCDDHGKIAERLLDLFAPEPDEEDEFASLRNDLDDLQNQREDLTERLTKTEAALKKQQELVHSLRYNGARHWFAFGWDKPTINGSPYVRFCKVCEKDEGHPAHFQSDATYLDSRRVDEGVRTVRARLELFLRHQMNMSNDLACESALDLLGGFPGIPGKGVRL